MNVYKTRGHSNLYFLIFYNVADPQTIEVGVILALLNAGFV